MSMIQKQASEAESQTLEAFAREVTGINYGAPVQHVSFVDGVAPVLSFMVVVPLSEEQTAALNEKLAG